MFHKTNKKNEKGMFQIITLSKTTIVFAIETGFAKIWC